VRAAFLHTAPTSDVWRLASAFRTRSGVGDTLSRHCVRHVRHRFAFSLASALRSTASAAGRPALFGGFVATMAESDFSCPCIIGFGSSPSPGGATASRIAMPHILPSTVPSVSASATFFLSWLNPPPHPITVYASHPPSPTTAQHSLPGGALPPYRGRSFTGRIASASPDAPEPEVRIHLPPADSQSLSRSRFRRSRTRLSARVWPAGLATGSAETRRVFRYRVNRGQYLCRAIFQYRGAAGRGAGLNAVDR